MKIKILIDHVSREINFAVKLKKYIESNELGFVAICHQDYINNIVDYDFFKSTFDGDYDIIITPSYNVVRTPEILLRTVAARAKLVVYHSEQIFNDQYISEKLNTGNSLEYDKHVTAHLVWGDFFAEKLVRYSKIKPEKIYIVGNYKFDFIIPNESINGRVLLASDYKVGDLSDDDMRKFSEEYRVNLPENLNRVVNQARKDALDWFENAALSYPGITFCLRPHPGESTKLYKKLSYLGNVEISDMSRSYADDLLRSDVIFGYTSTSVLEILKANKKFYSLKTVDSDLSYLSIHSELLTWISKEEFFEVLDKIAKHEVIRPSTVDYNKINNIVEPYSDVTSNVVCALTNINNASFTTTLSFRDLLRLKIAFFIGTGKFLAIKMSNSFPKLTFSEKIKMYSQDSYCKRLESAEIIDSSIIDNEFDKIENCRYVQSSLVANQYGWKFESNEN
ncbi:hypothetical protein DS893_05590 [Vibrionales bacterium C3R12]|nr:hypothetical protein DS893_05590 [Vibrionales bacterium C3R12]